MKKPSKRDAKPSKAAMPNKYAPGMAEWWIGQGQRNEAFFAAREAMGKTMRELAEHALTGHGPCARELAGWATFCTEQLRDVAEKHPHLFTDRKDEIPLLVKRMPNERWPEEVKRQALRLGCDLSKTRGPKKPAPHAKLKLRKVADGLVGLLNRLRAPASYTELGLVDQSWIVRKILDDGKWSADGDAKVWKGWRGAARFLPPPSVEFREIWWDATQARLSELYGAEWWLNPTFLRQVGMSFPDTPDKRDQKTFIGHIKPRFFEAVARLAL